MPDTLLVFANAPNQACAERIAQALIAQHVAACVNILPSCQSYYHWRGKVEHANEIPMLIKTSKVAWPKLEQTFCALHPYELPELIAVPISLGLPNYLNWIIQETPTTPL